MGFLRLRALVERFINPRETNCNSQSPKAGMRGLAEGGGGDEALHSWQVSPDSKSNQNKELLNSSGE